MGDTITHLDSLANIKNLIKNSHQQLQPNGKLIFTYRDLSEVKKKERFFTVKTDEKRILTCFLEDDGDQVKVFDLLHENNDRKWSISKSFYRKLKIPAAWLNQTMTNAGFNVKTSQLPNGMVSLIGHK